MVEESEEVVEEVIEEKVKKPTAKEMKEENDALEIELERTDALNARRALGGQSEAGQAPVKPAAPTDEEIAEKFDKGEVDILK